MSVNQKPPAAKPAPSVFGSDAAPIVYADYVVAFGANGDIVQLERGMLERDIGEEMGFRFYVPISTKIADGVVFCEFRTRPVPRHAMHPDDLQPRLRLVK